MSRTRVALAVLAAAWAVALPSAGVASAASWTAYSSNYGGGSVTPINTSTNVAGTSIVVNDPADIAITPDGRTAWVATWNEGTVTPIDLATRVVGSPITVGAGPYAIAITPDGSRAYTANHNAGTVTPINLATRTAGTPIAVGLQPDAIAITPNGTKAYVANQGSDSVTPITLATGTAGTPIPVGDRPVSMAITPDGAKLFVANYTSDTVTPISTATDTAGTTIPVADPAAIAVSPNGTMAYATNYAAGTVTPITVATGATGTPITGAGTQPYQLAFTPNGASGYVAGAWTPGTLTPFNLGTGIAGSAITVGNQASGVAITPDQAPVASFTATPGLAGSPTTFNASASTVTYGTIARYVWEFGDGATAVTTAPTVAHTYAAAGVYTSRVTETSSGGTSTTRVFTGKTVSRNGGPGAVATRTVVVSKPSVSPPPGSPPPDDEDPGPTASQSKPVGIAKKRITMTRRGIVPIRLHCAKRTGRCKGTLTLSMSRPRASASASGRRSLRKRIVIAREHFSIKAGKSKTIKAHVARNGRRRVLRNRKVKCQATVATRSASGKRTASLTTVTLRAPR